MHGIELRLCYVKLELYLNKFKYCSINNLLWLMNVLLRQSNIEIQPYRCHNDFTI